jgi:hypothetical protein
MPVWGHYDLTSSLHVDASGLPFTGWDAARTMGSALLCNLLPCLILFLASVGLILGGLITRRLVPTRRYAEVVLLDGPVAIVLFGILVVWLYILIMHGTGWKAASFVDSFRYSTLFTAFWLVPLAIATGLVLRLGPELLLRIRQRQITCEGGPQGDTAR